MSKFISWFTIVAACYFFFLFLPKAMDDSKRKYEAVIQKAVQQPPKLKETRTKFGKIKRVIIEGDIGSEAVELVEYPNGLICVKVYHYTAHGKGAGIDCNWENYKGGES